MLTYSKFIEHLRSERRISWDATLLEYRWVKRQMAVYEWYLNLFKKRLHKLDLQIAQLDAHPNFGPTSFLTHKMRKLQRVLWGSLERKVGEL